MSPELLPFEKVIDATDSQWRTAFYISQIANQPYDYTLKVLRDHVNKGVLLSMKRGARELYKRSESNTMEVPN